MSYVGPGATAAFIGISPQPATLAPLALWQFNAHVFDHLEQTVTDLPVTWSTTDATIATVTQTGLVTTTGKVGSTTLVVTGLNGITGQAAVNVRPVATLSVLGGDKQSGIVGSALTTRLAVQAMDASGNLVIGATINFSAVNGLGSVSPASAITDATGIASTTLTLGQGIGTYTFTATVAGSSSVLLVGDVLAGVVQVTATVPQTSLVPISFTATLRPGKASQLIMIQQPSTAAQATVPLGTQPKLQVTDQFANPVAGLTIIATTL